jgi:hypothetical protein
VSRAIGRRSGGGWAFGRILAAWWCVAAAAVVGAEPDYAKEIKPLLKARCYACHGALKQKAELRLDAVALMRKGGESGDILEEANALLLEKVTATDKEERMPPEGTPLKPEEIARLKEWIAAGAPAPANEQPEEDPRRHWAYQPPRVATAVAGRADGTDGTTGGGPIDSLIGARLKERGLTAQPPAAPEVWLRRVYLDLTGLPPTAGEVRTFLAENAAAPAAVNGEAPELWRRTVDRLLASPAYGERWARHFMDIWRYSDWYGLDGQLRHSQKHLWHWRDWIVEALNADKGYDRMIVEMLAADEAAPEDREALRATGFLARNYYLFNRTTWLDEVVEHTSRAFLGVTMQCVKCHDHKFDPISQVEYYRMRAVFEPYHVRLDPWPGETDLEKNGLPRAFDLQLEKPTYLHRRGDEKNEDKAHPLAPGVPAVLAFAEFQPKAVTLPAAASRPVLLPFVGEDRRRVAEGEIARAKSAVEDAGRKLEEARQGAFGAAGPPTTPAALEQAEASVPVAEKALAAAELQPAVLRTLLAAERAEAGGMAAEPLEACKVAAALAETEYQFSRAEAELAKARLAAAGAAKDKAAEAAKKLQAAEKAVADWKPRLASPGNRYPPLHVSLKALEGPEDKGSGEVQVYPATSTGRRLALAQWIANERNPLTARVLVNHIWLRHFGASLVPDVSDFGRRCPAPLQQDVLDTLAVDFMQHGWSLKRLHRAMVLSELYRRSSSNAGATAATLAADPDNACYWRMNPRRLESQAVRDAVLSVAGRLDLRMGGPGIDPASAEASPRRALYFTQTADVEHRFLAAFDNSNVLECYRRAESIMPQQALALANSKLARECAEALAKSMEKLGEAEFIEQAFWTLLSRAPTDAERAACAASLGDFAALQSKQGRALVLHALMNHNDFVTLR